MKLRKKNPVSYSELEEPSFDEYLYCDKCGDFVYEYCSIHGALLVIPDDKVPFKTGLPSFVPRAALTIPHQFLHLAPSIIPGAGLGVFSTVTLPTGVRFGPYRGRRLKNVETSYCWQIYDDKKYLTRVIDGSDCESSNWMRYVNCSRHYLEQNLVAYQYQGEIYYRTIKIIPRFTELMVFYGSEFARHLGINLRLYNTDEHYFNLQEHTTKNYFTGSKPENRVDFTTEPAVSNVIRQTILDDNFAMQTMTVEDFVMIDADETEIVENGNFNLPPQHYPEDNSNQNESETADDSASLEHKRDTREIYFNEDGRKYLLNAHSFTQCNPTFSEEHSNKYDTTNGINDDTLQLDANKHKCEICCKQLKRYALTHSNKCSVTPVTFSEEHSNENNTPNVFNDTSETDNAKHSCKICFKQYLSTYSLKRHIASTHFPNFKYERFSTIVSGSNEFSDDKNMGVKGKLKCNLCSNIFSLEAFKIHIIFHHSSYLDPKLFGHFNFQLIANVNNISYKEKPVSNGVKKAYVCGICLKTFGSSFKHHGCPNASVERSFSCYLCDFKTISLQFIRQHYYTMHSQQVKHYCDHCGKSYCKKWNLKCHKLKVHSEKIDSVNSK